MKPVRILFAILPVLLLTFGVTSLAFSQKNHTASFAVSGNCGMCEAKIEKAAKAAGASYAEWNKDTKLITVKYNASGSELDKIKKSIADAGYDNAGIKASEEAYNRLHSCCKYERTATSDKIATQSSKENETENWQPGQCNMSGPDGKNGCPKEAAVMNCCKDSRCSKEENNGKDCCKKF